MHHLQRAPAGPPGTLNYAMSYADATYDGYRAKLREELERSNQLGQGLLTLSTLAVGAAIGNAHRDVLITAALGGGLAYQLGTWNQSSDRLDVYLEGMKAMACAKAAVAPLRLSEAARNEIVAAEQAVGIATTPVADALADTVRWLNVAMASQTPDSETAQTARAEIAETAALFTRLNELHQRSASLRQNADGAGAMLEARIDEMRRQIDVAIKSRQATLASLPQQIGAIASYANTIVPGLQLDTAFQTRVAAIKSQLPTGSGQQSTAQFARDNKARDAAPAPLEPRDHLASALGRLQAKRALLAIQAARLTGTTDRATNRVKEDLAGCNVDATKLAVNMRLARTQIEFTAGQSKQSRVPIIGGTQQFTATPVDTPMPGLLSVIQPGASEVLIIADTTTVAGTYQINVQDAAQNSALLTLTVLPAAAATPATPTTRECTGSGWSNRTLACFVQHSVGTKATGTKDASTCEAFIKKFPDNLGVLDDNGRAAVLVAEKLDAKAKDAELKAVLGPSVIKECGITTDTSERLRSPAPATPGIGARTIFEKRLGPDEIRIISKGLEMNPPVSELNDEFRRGLGSYQKRHGLADTKGTLPEDLAKSFLK
ncbi:hypothetical protein [Roseateles sp. LYH14W]|uniref:Uncharacterized protein n=1 Tax=Pelomonas parva TaxID=3299032 RepID=A0ABW7FC95_9BURK